MPRFRGAIVDTMVLSPTTEIVQIAGEGGHPALISCHQPRQVLCSPSIVVLHGWASGSRPTYAYLRPRRCTRSHWAPPPPAPRLHPCLTCSALEYRYKTSLRCRIACQAAVVYDRLCAHRSVSPLVLRQHNHTLGAFFFSDQGTVNLMHGSRSREAPGREEIRRYLGGPPRCNPVRGR